MTAETVCVCFGGTERDRLAGSVSRRHDETLISRVAAHVNTENRCFSLPASVPATNTQTQKGEGNCSTIVKKNPNLLLPNMTSAVVGDLGRILLVMIVPAGCYSSVFGGVAVG